MIRYLRATMRVFMNYRYLLYNLVGRDIKVKYRRSVLGMLWSVLNPLLMMLVMTFVFQNLFVNIMDRGDLPVVSVTGLPPSFPVYLLTGQLIFNFFSDATNMAMDSVLGNAQLIKKVYIPKYIFPLEKVMFALVNTLFSMLSLVLVLIITQSPVTLWALLAPVVLLVLFVFNLGVGLILSSMVVFFRDIKHLYSVFVLALTYMTPIFYPEAILAEMSAVRFVIRLNPMYWFVDMFRQVVVYGVAPTPTHWLTTCGSAAAVLVVGLLIFRKTQDEFILHV